MRTTMINANVITPNLEFKGGLVIDDGKIVKIYTNDENSNFNDKNIISTSKDKDFPWDGKIIDVNGLYLSPGFIDVHVHGGGGADFMDNESDTFETILNLHMNHGTTALSPTTLASSLDDILKTIQSYENALSLKSLPEMIGIHLEGPYVSFEHKGALDPAYIKSPEPEEYMKILDSTKHIKRWSIAPELEGALSLGMELKRRGIIAAIAHSDTVYDVVAMANDYGFDFMTHFYSAMSTVKRINAYRHAGVIESGYLMDEFNTEIIADGHHLPASLLKLIYKVKGSSKICLITDSMRAAGLPDYDSYLGKKDADFPVIVEDGVAKLPDRSVFAGSVATADVLIRTMIEKAEVPLKEAIKMITLTPAKIMGVEHKMGSIAVSKDANLVVFDKNINIKKVFIRGELVVNNL